jgi:hypothetical protein
MDQLTLGDELRDQGMAVATANSDPQLVKAVDAAIEVCAGRYPLFTADHVRDLVTVGMGYDGDVGRIIGARMNAAGRRRQITNTGMTTKSTRADAHSRRLLVWRRA